MPEVIKFDYFYGEESEQYSFFRIPRLLVTSERFKVLSSDAKLLYTFMLDRMGLSARNGWYDEKGRVYIYYPLEEVCGLLNCSHGKAVRVFAELDTTKGVGLIERVRQGLGRPSRIYVKKFSTKEIPSAPTGENQENQNKEIQKSHFDTSGFFSLGNQEVSKGDGNNIDLNKTEKNYTDLSIKRPGKAGAGLMDRLACQSELENQLDAPLLREQYPADDIESILSLLADCVSSTAATLKIGGEDIPAEQVKQRYRELDHTHIEYVLDSLQSNTTQITNIRAYLLTALYNAPVTIGPYYAAKVRHDLA